MTGWWAVRTVSVNYRCGKTRSQLVLPNCWSGLWGLIVPIFFIRGWTYFLHFKLLVKFGPSRSDNEQIKLIYYITFGYILPFLYVLLSSPGECIPPHKTLMQERLRSFPIFCRWENTGSLVSDGRIICSATHTYYATTLRTYFGVRSLW